MTSPAPPPSTASLDLNRGATFQAELERDRAHRASTKSLKPLRRLVPFITPYWGTLSLFLFFLFLASSLTLSLPGTARLLLDCGFNASPTSDYCNIAGIDGATGGLAPYFLIGMVVAALLGIASAARFYFVSRLGERVVADLRQAVFSHITALSPAFYERTRTGEVLSRLTTDTTLIQTVVGTSISVAIRTTVTTTGAIVLMSIVNLKLTLIVLVVGPLVLGPIMFFGRRIRRLSRTNQDNLADASARASETLTAIETVQAFTREPQERAAFGAAVEATYRVAMRRVLTRSLMTALIFSMVLCSVIAALWYGSEQVRAGVVTGGQILQFMMYSFIAVSGIGMLTETWTEMMRAAGASERLMELLAEVPDIAPPAALPATAQTTNRAPLRQPSVRGAIAFDGVTFSYPTRATERALVDFSLAVEPGETVALVGPSGAGKSTVFQLLLRFYDPQSGRVTLDGHDLRAFDPADLRGAMAIVQQNAPLFSGDAYSNIGFGKPGASEADIRAAARAAHADAFINALPEGYETDLGERASTLSGGQRQRIAIARAILRDAPVFLLDEATSALDAESERAVQDAISALAKDRTTIIIAHRLATILQADRIVVMDGGRIVDEGRHDALVAKGGLYARLARLQFNTAYREKAAE